MTAEWDDLARLAQAATPGEWEAVGYDDMPHDVVQIGYDDQGDPWATGMIADSVHRPDAEFIAAANPATILRLITGYRAWQEEASEALGKVATWEQVANRIAAERDALAARLAAVEAEHEALADSLRAEAAQIVSRVSDEPMRQPTHVDELLGIDPNDTAMRSAARTVQAQRQLTLFARRLAAVEALADEWERTEAYRCTNAGECPRCLAYQSAVIRLRRAALAAPTDTTKEN